MTSQSSQPETTERYQRLSAMFLFVLAIVLGIAAFAIFVRQGDYAWSWKFKPGVYASLGLGAVGAGLWWRLKVSLIPFLCGFFALVCMGLGFFAETLAVGWFWISALMLGAAIAPLNSDPLTPSKRVTIQLGLGASLLNLIIAVCIYTTGLSIPLILALSGLIAIWFWTRHRTIPLGSVLLSLVKRAETPTPLVDVFAVFALLSVLAMLVLVGSFPDAGSDSVSAYRAMLKQLQVTGRLDYSPENSILRLQPIFGVWTQAYAVVLSDSYAAAKLLNASLLIIAACLVLSVVRDRVPACLAVVATFSLPLFIFTTISGFYDNATVFLGALFTALAIGLTSHERRMRSEDRRPTLFALGLVSAVLVLTKLTSLYAVPGFVLFFIILRWRSVSEWKGLSGDVLLIGIVAAIPVLAFSAFVWLQTGNPVFPYYNAVFESPYFDQRNFKSPHTGYASWRFIWDMTFDTAAYAQRGARDGQLGILMVSGLFAVFGCVVIRSRLSVASVVSFFAIILIMSAFQNSARYMMIAVPFLALALAETFRSDLRWAACLAAIALALPNWAMLPKFGYTAVDFSSAWKSNHTAYIRRFAPVARLTDRLSEDLGPYGRVLFAERNGGFVGQSLETGWYDGATSQIYKRMDHTDPEIVRDFLSRNRIDAVVVNNAGLGYLVRYDRLAFLDHLEDMSDATEVIDGVRLYRIDPRLSHTASAMIEPQTMQGWGSFLETKAAESLRATFTYNCAGTVFVYATELDGRRGQNSARSPLICNGKIQTHTIAARPSTLKTFDGVNLYADIRRESELEILSGQAVWR